jgi:uncharacterized membrane protein
VKTTRSRLVTASRTANDLWSRGERFVKSRLLWNRLYQTTSYLRSALWTTPLLSILVVLAVAPLLRVLDRWLGWRLVGLGVAGATALYQTVVTLTLSFLVFTFGSLLVAIQVAGGQLTPRIIATTLLRDRVVKYSVGLFVFSLMFSVIALNRVGNTVYEIVSLVVALLGIASMATFLFLIDHAARLLRPVSILAHVGNQGQAVIESVYPDLAGDEGDVALPPAPPPSGPRRIVSYTGTPQIVLAIDLETLVLEAQRFDGLVECVPQVGDFVGTEEPLFVLYGGAVSIDDRRLLAMAAFGSERTLEQDPLFAFRIMADIALKALSPAINDPTTAVLAMDQIHRLLRVVGKRGLRGEVVADDRGHPRVIFRTPNWDDFVHVSCNEIRSCGAGNLQVARRMRALLDNLIAALPPHRHPTLLLERRLLDRAIESLYPFPEDLALAKIPDLQGLGGASGTHRPAIDA